MLEEALDIAIRIESVESTQRLLDTRSSSRSEPLLTISEGDPSSDNASVQYVGAANTQLARLQKQLEQLTYEIQQIKIDKHKPPCVSRPMVCWNCEKPGHIRRNCKNRQTYRNTAVNPNVIGKGLVENVETDDTGSAVTIIQTYLGSHTACSKTKTKACYISCCDSKWETIRYLWRGSTPDPNRRIYFPAKCYAK